MRTKIFYLPFLIFILTISSYAQIKIGILGGVNSTGFSGDSPPNGSFSSGSGYSAGITADYYFLDDVAINLQSIFSSKSTIVQFEVNYQYEDYDSLKIKIDYFEIPLNVKVMADNKITYVTAGLTFSFPLSSSLTDQTTGSETDITDSLEPLQIGANFGVGVEFNLGKPILFIEARYTQSLTNLTKEDIGENTIKAKIKSNSWQLYAGLLFTL